MRGLAKLARLVLDLIGYVQTITHLAGATGTVVFTAATGTLLGVWGFLQGLPASVLSAVVLSAVAATLAISNLGPDLLRRLATLRIAVDIPQSVTANWPAIRSGTGVGGIGWVAYVPEMRITNKERGYPATLTFTLRRRDDPAFILRQEADFLDASHPLVRTPLLSPVTVPPLSTIQGTMRFLSLSDPPSRQSPEFYLELHELLTGTVIEVDIPGQYPS